MLFITREGLTKNPNYISILQIPRKTGKGSDEQMHLHRFIVPT